MSLGTYFEKAKGLSHFLLREPFLTRLFAMAAFRQVARTPEMKNLIAFHAAHKYLRMRLPEATPR
jgi:uncharacterized protein YbgA (DUF1722 family)